MSVLGNKVLIRCISSLVILPDSFNLSIFTFDSSSGISISLIKVSSNCFISSSFSRTEGNSFTLRLIPLPLASAFNLFMSPVLSVFFFLTIQPICGLSAKFSLFCLSPMKPDHNSSGVSITVSLYASIYFKSTFTISLGSFLRPTICFRLFLFPSLS